MNFDLSTPCSNCPFRTDCMPAWLGQERAQGIVAILDVGGTFQCHKTRGDNGQHCAGALIMLKKAQGGFNGAASLACALGLLDYAALDLEAPVFETTESFVDHHKETE